MGIDPMAMSQGMYGGFGGPGMGMNGMNMGMGFDAGQGAYSGFNGQSTAWNAGQNKIYQNAHGGHANGMGVNDFGANAAYSGYNMPQHQGNFNQMHHHQYPNNDFQHGYHNQGFQGRGRGRGRGGYYNAGRGRGGYAQVAQGNHTNHENFHQQVPQGPVRRGSPQYTPMAGHQNGENPQEGKIEDAASKQAAEDQLNKDLAPGDANDQDEKALVTQTEEAEAKTFVEADETNAVPLETKSSEQPEADVAEAAVNLPAEDFKPAPIETFISDDLPKSEAPVPEEIVSVPSAMLPPPSPVIPTGPSHSMEISPRGRGRGFHTRGFTTYRGGPQGRGSEFLPNGSINPVDKSAVPPIAPKGLGVEGAPKGPKALRQGLPNASVRENLGMSIVGRASAAAQSRANGDSKMKRYVPDHEFMVCALKLKIALAHLPPHRVHVRGPLLDIILQIPDTIAYVRQVPVVNRTRHRSGTSIILEDMMIKGKTERASTVRIALEPTLLTPLSNDRLTERVATQMIAKRRIKTPPAAVIDHTVPIAREAERRSPIGRRRDQDRDLQNKSSTSTVRVE